MSQKVGIKFQFGGPTGSTPQVMQEASIVLTDDGDIALLEKFVNQILKPKLEQAAIAAQNSMPGGKSIGYTPLLVLNVDQAA